MAVCRSIGDGMLILRAHNSQVRRLRLRRIQLVLRLYQVLLGIDAGFVERIRQSSRSDDSSPSCRSESCAPCRWRAVRSKSVARQLAWKEARWLRLRRWPARCRPLRQFDCGCGARNREYKKYQKAANTHCYMLLVRRAMVPETREFEKEGDAPMVG